MLFSTIYRPHLTYMIKEYIYIKFLIKPTRITFELWGLVSASNRNMEADIYPLVFVLTEVGCSLMSSAARVWAGVGLWRRWSRTGFGGDGESTKQKWGLLSPPLSSAPLPSHTHTHTSWHLNRPSVLGMQDHRLCFFFISLLSLFEYVLHDEGSTGECRSCSSKLTLGFLKTLPVVGVQADLL